MCPKEMFDWTVFSRNFLSFVTVFRLWAVHSSTLARKLWKSCRRRILLEKQVFWGKFVFTFTNFSRFDEKLCGRLSESLPPYLKNCFLHSFRGLRAHHYHFPRENIRLLTDFEGKCLEFCKVILTWWSKLFSLCPEDIFEEILFFFTKSSKFSVVFRLWGNISDFWQNYSSWVVKTVFLVSRRHFWRNNILFHKTFKFFSCFQTLRKYFGFLAKIFLLGCQNCFQMCRGYFWKCFFLKTNSLNLLFLFGLRAQIFWTFDENFAIGLSKLHFMCPVEIFGWTVFPTKLYKFFLPSSGCESKSLKFGRKSFKKFVKTAIYVYKKILWKI